MTAAAVALKQLFQLLGSLYSHYAKRRIKIGAKKRSFLMMYFI